MSKFIELPDGGLVTSESIVAIRCCGPRPDANLKPQIIVDYVVGTCSRSIILDCKTIEDRNQLVTNLKSQIFS